MSASPAATCLHRRRDAMLNTWMIASGKGGVGKSTLAAALAVALVRMGKKTVLMDMDLGLRSLDIHLGMENSVVFDVLDYVRGDSKLSQAVLPHLQMPELGLLPASQAGSAQDVTDEHLEKIVRKLQKRYEYVLADAPAGLERGIGRLLQAVKNTLLVVTPDDVSIRDGERIVALLPRAGAACTVFDRQSYDPRTGANRRYADPAGGSRYAGCAAAGLCARRYGGAQSAAQAPNGDGNGLSGARCHPAHCQETGGHRGTYAGYRTASA